MKGLIVMKIGLIRGRHPLPVERYLIEQETVPFNQAHTMARDAMMKLAQEHRGDIDLYITGLTRATLGAIAGWMKAKNRTVTCDYLDPIPETETLRIWEWNAQTGEYETVIAFPARSAIQPVVDMNGSYEIITRVSATVTEPFFVQG
jgi:hypothetical protein